MADPHFAQYAHLHLRAQRQGRARPRDQQADRHDAEGAVRADRRCRSAMRRAARRAGAFRRPGADRPRLRAARARSATGSRRCAISDDHRAHHLQGHARGGRPRRGPAHAAGHARLRRLGRRPARAGDRAERLAHRRGATPTSSSTCRPRSAAGGDGAARHRLRAGCPTTPGTRERALAAARTVRHRSRFRFRHSSASASPSATRELAHGAPAGHHRVDSARPRFAAIAALVARMAARRAGRRRAAASRRRAARDTARARRFARQLRAASACRSHAVDERYTAEPSAPSCRRGGVDASKPRAIIRRRSCAASSCSTHSTDRRGKLPDAEALLAAAGRRSCVPAVGRRRRAGRHLVRRRLAGRAAAARPSA